jgi:hypothetical protein
MTKFLYTERQEFYLKTVDDILYIALYMCGPDRPGVHPASYTMGTGSFQGGKRPGRGVDHQPHLAPKLKKK